MENQQQKPLSQEETLAEILENSRQTKTYAKWQLIITVALVVVPVLAMVFIIPFVIRSLTAVYSGTIIE